MKLLKELGIGICLGGSLALAGCGQETVAPSLAELNCPEIQGAEALLTRSGLDLIVFGELHGMAESPQFVADMICHDLKLHGRSVLALEKSKDMRADLDAYLSEVNEEEARRAFLKTESWNHDMQDGRSSVAMFELMKTMKGYQKLGYDVSISLFISGKKKKVYVSSVPRHVNAKNHEQDMADNLVQAVSGIRNSGESGHVIALVGQVHAKQKQGNYYEKPYDLMAKLLPKNSAISLNNNHSVGTSWNCIGAEDGGFKCGASETGNYVADVFKKDDEIIQTRAVHIFKEANDRGYDGYFYIGKATASPPAHTLITD